MADEPQNSDLLRAQAAFLLSQAHAQAFDLQRALGRVGGEPALRARLAAASAKISDVASAISDAMASSAFPLNAGDLMSLGDIVQSGEASALISEAATQAAITSAGSADVAARSEATRNEVQTLSHDVFDQHLFDSYLHFSSAADEEEFRKREAEAKKYVDAQLARNTPEGNLNAGGGMIGEMLELHAHGAGDSPDFAPHWNELTGTTGRQRAAMQAAGQSTQEYDQHVSASVRRFLKTEKGMSDAQINALLAKSPDPVDAVKPFIGSNNASHNLAHHIAYAADDSTRPLARVETTSVATPADIPLTINPDAITAKLKAAGLQLPDGKEITTEGHGLTVQKPVGKDGPNVAG